MIVPLQAGCNGTTIGAEMRPHNGPGEALSVRFGLELGITLDADALDQ